MIKVTNDNHLFLDNCVICPCNAALLSLISKSPSTLSLVVQSHDNKSHKEKIWKDLQRKQYVSWHFRLNRE